jgi:hypothetical protein
MSRRAVSAAWGHCALERRFGPVQDLWKPVATEEAFETVPVVRGEMAEAVKRALGRAAFFDVVHCFTPHPDVPEDTALRLVGLADETIALLSSDPSAAVRVVVEISADFPEGASDKLKRDVSENTRSLGLKHAEWE